MAFQRKSYLQFLGNLRLQMKSAFFISLKDELNGANFLQASLIFMQ
tara:strand:+ start:286 stop:423 length:138 start_codon:yes stop_codon:yes gene_type:complete